MNSHLTADPRRLARIHLQPLALTALIGSAFATLCSAAPLGPDTGMKWDLTPAQIAATCKGALAEARSRIHLIDAGAGKPLTFNEGLGAIETVAADLNEQLSAATTLSVLAVERAQRDAATACSNDAAAFGVELAADPAVYKLAQAAATRAATPEEHQLAKIYLETGSRSAAGLDPATRAKVTKLLDQINALQIAFARAIGEDHSQIDLGADELSSLPASLNAAIHKDPDGVHLAVNESTSESFLNNETSGNARRRYLIAYARRGGPANVKRLAEAVELRSQAAQVLGYPTWAAYQLNVKMAKTPERALSLVQEVDKGLLSKGRAEVAELANLKRASGDASPFERWDYAYFENQLIKTRYAVDQEQIRQYFPLEKALPAMLGIYSHLLSVRFEALQPAKAWAPRVTEYAIYDARSGEAIGWFFLDLFPREGKFQHFAAFPLRFGRVLPDGSYRKPVSAIVGNWPSPEAGKPALLSHDDLVAFFHEFGHVMHETLSHTRYASLFGPNTRADFTEAPSQMLENWMWQPQILKRISGRLGTGEPLPDALIQKMIALKHVDDGVHWSNQAFFAIYDLQLHGAVNSDPTALWFSLRPQLTPFTEIPDTYPEASFGHLMGGYDAGYYGYLWSLVYAQDMYNVFQKGGLENPEIGMKYRNEILVPGASVEADVLLRHFLGREVSVDPFYEHVGIKRGK